jgi:hypothetical protein
MIADRRHDAGGKRAPADLSNGRALQHAQEMAAHEADARPS